MAKGWESKNVEEQLADRDNAASAASAAKKQAAGRMDADVLRQRQALELQREQVLNERTSNPHRRAALAAALAYLEEKLTALDKPA